MIKKITIMGVLNITPDSFYDGNKYNNFDKAKQHIEYLVNSGADIIDVGGESTRPNADVVSVDEELSRVIPIIQYIKKNYNIPVSIDTSNAQVMKAAVLNKVDMINDVRAFSNVGAIEVAVKSNLPICIMHMKGTPKTMQKKIKYKNVILEIIDFLQKKINFCLKCGIKKNNIIIDPGFGFGKSLDNNIEILKNIDKFCNMGFPVLVGISRKSMIGAITDAPVEKRLAGSIACNILAYQQGASIFRVHDVYEVKQALQIANTLLHQGNCMKNN